MSQYEITYNEIIYKLRATKNKETFYLFSSGLFKALAISTIIVFAATLIEAIAHGDETFRGILAGIILSTLLITVGLILFPVIMRLFGIKYLPTDEKVALRVGRFYPDLKDNLCNTLQLVSGIEHHNGTSPSLALAAFDNVSSIAKTKDFDVIINKQDIKRSMLLFLMAAILTFGSMAVLPSTMGAAFKRVVNWNKSYLPPAPFTLRIEPLNANILRGQPATIKVITTGTPPENISLYIKEEQQENYDVYKLKADSSGVFKYEINSIKNTVIFYAEANWLSTTIKTDEGKITVTDKPIIRAFNGKLIFPSYANLAPRNFDEKSADISALKGSRIELQVLSSKDLEAAAIVFEKTVSLAEAGNENSVPKVDTIYYKMNVDGKKATGGFAVTTNGNYYVVLKDKSGQFNDDPIKYNIVALTDEYPSISMITPVTDVQIGEDGLLPVKVAISDDYGFSSLKLHYRLTESKYTSPQEQFATVYIPLLNPGLAAEVPYLWDLNKINISPEDKYEFYLEVSDNDRISGPKTAKTQVLTVRLPSLDEVFKKADEDQAKVQNDLEKTIKEAENVRKDMEELTRDLMKNQKQQEVDWKQKKKAEDIMKKQAQLEQKINDIQKNIEDITKNLDENKALSPETMQKYMELQKLMKDINSPELKKLQERMEQALKNISQEDLQKALKNFQFNEEQFKASIERTLNILKKLQAEQKVDALTKRAEELAKKQQELEQQLKNTNPNDKQKKDDLASQQAKSQDELKNIQKEMKDLEKLMKEIGNMPMNELNKANQELNPNETQQEMQNAEENINKNNFDKASQSQKKASSNLQKFAQQMKKLKQEMNNKITKEAMRKMQKAISDLLKLSQQQEGVKDKTQSTDNNSTQYSDLAEQQAQLQEALGNVANSMVELSQRTFAVTPEMGKQLGNALNQMQQSKQSLANRSSHNAASAQSQAMSSMNQSIISMQNMLSAMQGSGSCDNPGGMGEGKSGNNGQGFMDRLQQLTQQQQSINQAMQQMGMQGGKLSQEQMAQVARLANSQGQAQQAAQDLAREQKQQTGDRKQALADLDKIAKDMESVANDLKNNQITPETMKRQERILSRLLDATRSIHDRDFENKRESRTGKDVIRNSPGGIDLDSQEGRTRAMQELMKSIQQGYSKDYEALIRMYFESLQQNKK